MDVAKIRAQFPIVDVRVPSRHSGTNPLRYFDHASSTHPPLPVVDAVTDLVRSGYANVHRGNYHLSRRASDAFDEARETLLRFIGGRPESGQILFSQNTTSAIEMAAHLMTHVPGDTVISHLEHHSNDLPHRRRGRVHRIDPDGDLARLPALIEDTLRTHRVKLVAITGASNVTGEVPPLHEVAKVAHDYGAKVLVDAAQRFAHRRIDVGPADAPGHFDFVAAAGHKSYAPFGSSLLYGPRDLLDAAPPATPGGGTVLFVDRERAHFSPSPDRHEGGTPNVVGAVAFAAAASWLQGIGMDEIEAHERRLVARLRAGFQRIEGLRTYKVGGATDKVGVESFNLDGWTHAELATELDDGWGIACRDGCFCAHPLMVDLLGVRNVDVVQEDLLAGRRALVPGMVRASTGAYNDDADVDTLVEALQELAAATPRRRATTVVTTTSEEA